MKWKFLTDGPASVCLWSDRRMINVRHKHTDHKVKYRKFYHDWWQCWLGHCLYYARMMHLSYLCFLQAFHIKLMNWMVADSKIEIQCLFFLKSIPSSYWWTFMIGCNVSGQELGLLGFKWLLNCLHNWRKQKCISANLTKHYSDLVIFINHP